MARRTSRSQPSDAVVQQEAQQDEADIGRELGVEKGVDGELVADEGAVRKAGAVDTESVRENRRLTRIVHNKRTGKQNVQINVDDVLVKYDQMLRLYPADSMYISVKRVSGGSAVQQAITSAPRNGVELYNAILRAHGRHEEAAYAVNFFDSTSKEYRGKGQITMPDTRDPATVQGQPPMNYPPYGGYPTGQQPPHGYAQPFQPPPPPAPAPPQTPDLGALLTSFQKLQEVIRANQFGAQAPATQPPVGAPTDPLSAQFDQLQQMLDLMRSQQGVQSPRAVAPQPGAVNPQMAAAMMGGMGVPPVQPPPGTIWVPGFGFVSLEALMQVLGGGGRPVGGMGPRSPFRSPFASSASSAANGEEQPPPYRGGPPYAQGNQASQQERSPAQAFRDSVGVIRTVSDAMREIQTLFPGQEPQEPATTVSIEDEDSPIRVIETPAAKLVLNRKDGSLRPWETGFANMDKIFAWAGQQIERVQQRETQQQSARRQLPPDTIEVTPGYQPPPGYVPVPLDANGAPQFGQAALPPPPSSIPPPLGYPPPVARQAPPPRQQAFAPRPAPSQPVPQPAPKRWGPPPSPPR